MRLPHVRITVRRLMFVVAGMAILLGASLFLHRRYEEYSSYAESHSEKAEWWYRSAKFNLDRAEKYTVLAAQLREEALASEPVANRQDSSDYAAELERKAEVRKREAAKESDRANWWAGRADAYRRAAIRPWLIVSPDPPEQE
jgi:hypothetical protein